MPHLAALTYLVRDYDEAIAYFTQTLGFTLLEDTQLTEEKRWVRVAPPNSPTTTTAVLLARAATPDQQSHIGRQTAGRVAFFLHTDDFQRDHARLLSHGVPFVRPPRHEPYGTVAVFQDLYGNLWDLIQPAALTSPDPSARPPFPPFTRDTANQKVRAAENAWNTRDPQKVSLAYTKDTLWRNRAEFLTGREEVVAFLQRKWARELDYRLIKEFWACEGNRIAVRFAYEWHDDAHNWFRSYGNENWEFAPNGLMHRRHASINDLPIRDQDRKYHWPQGPRPANHPGLSDLGL